MNSPKAVKLTVSRFTLTSGFCFAILVAILSSIAVADVTYTDSTIPTSNVTTGSSGVGNVTFEISGTSAYNNSILGDGNAYKTGTGTLTLNGSVSNTVSTYVNGGNLTLNCSYGWLATNKKLNVNSAQLNFARTDTFGNDSDIPNPWHLDVTNGTVYANNGTYNSLSQVVLQNSSLIDGGGYQNASSAYRSIRLGKDLEVSGTGTSYIKSENLNSKSGVHLYDTTNFWIYDSNKDASVNNGVDFIISSSLYNRVNKTSNLVKYNPGTMELSGTNYYTGNTSCAAGELIISGSIQSRIYANGGTITFNAPGKTSTMSADGYGSAAHVGFNATGTLNVKDGTVNVQSSNHSGSINLGIGSGNGTINVSGGKLHVDGRILMAANGGTSAKATLNISGNGLLEMGVAGSYSCTDKDDPGCGVLWFGNGVTTINLNGGTLAYYAMKSSGPAAGTTFNFNGGTVKAVATNNTNYMPVIDNLTYNVKEGGAKFDTNGYNVTVSANLQHDSTLGTTLDGGLTKSGNGTLTLTAENTYTGATKVTAGTLALTTENTIAKSSSVENNAAITMSAAQTFNNLSGNASGSINNGGKALVLYNNDNSTYAGTTSGTGELYKQGAGTITMTGVLSHTGLTQIQAGTMIISGDGYLNNSQVSIENGGTLVFDSTGTSNLNSNQYQQATQIGFVSTQGSTMTIKQGTVNVKNMNNASDYTGSINLGTKYHAASTGGAGTLNVEGGTLHVDGRILIAANNYNGKGELNITGGTVDLGVAGKYSESSHIGVLALGAGTSTINLDGGNLNMFAILYADTPSVGSTVSLNGTQIKAVANNANFITAHDSVQYLVKAGGAKFDTNGYDVTVSANLQHDSTLGTTLDGGLTKSGNGTLTLTGTNTYTGGTTINAGTVAVNKVAAIGSGDITLNGGTLNTASAGAGQTFSNGVIVGENGGSLTTYTGTSYSSFASISGSGALTTNGWVHFSGDGGYSGDLTIASGFTRVNPGAFKGADVQVKNGASFAMIESGTVQIGKLNGTGTTFASNKDQHVILEVGYGTTADDTATFSGQIRGGANNSQSLTIKKVGAGTQTFNRAGYATADCTNSIKEVIVDGGKLVVDASHSVFVGGATHGFWDDAPITVNSGSTIEFVQSFTTSPNVLTTINGGTLLLDKTQYVNKLDLNSATVTGKESIAVGYKGTPVWNVTGGTTTVNGSVLMVKDGSNTTFTVNVAKDATIDFKNQVYGLNTYAGMNVVFQGTETTTESGTQTSGGTVKMYSWDDNSYTMSNIGSVTLDKGVTVMIAGDNLKNYLATGYFNGVPVSIKNGSTLQVSTYHATNGSTFTLDNGTIAFDGDVLSYLVNVTMQNGSSVIGTTDDSQFWIGNWDANFTTINGTTENQMNTISANIHMYDNNKTLTFNVADKAPLTVSGRIQGNIATVKNGDGVLYLTSSENAMTKSLTINGGTVYLSDGGVLGTMPVTMSDNTTLTYAPADGETMTLSNTITGTGKVLKTGSGILLLPTTASVKANEFVVDAGTLKMTDVSFASMPLALNSDGNVVLSAESTPQQVTLDADLKATGTGVISFNFYDHSTGKYDQIVLDADNGFSIENDAKIALDFVAGDIADWAIPDTTYLLINDTGYSATPVDLTSFLADTYGRFELWGDTTGVYLLAKEPSTGVPEPSTWALLILGFAGLMWYQRRKRVQSVKSL